MTSIDYEEVFEKAEVGIALNNPEAGTIGRVNDRYANLMDYNPEELEDMQIKEISAKDSSFDQDSAMEKIQMALTGESQQFDWLFERKDASQFWGEVVLKRTQIGPHDRLLAFVRDKSERKQYERKLERKNQRLDKYASIVSHDITNPLNVAEGHLDMARKECNSEHLDRVASAHSRIETLIEDLLSLARAEKPIQDFEKVDLSVVAEQCWQNFDAESATLRNEVDVTINADPSRLQQLLENLLRNAIEHGGKDVTIEIGNHENGFYVEDDGPGIPPEERDDIFNFGYSTSSKGTGFGLAIVNQVVDTHDWNIGLSDGSTGGARFEITTEPDASYSSDGGS